MGAASLQISHNCPHQSHTTFIFLRGEFLFCVALRKRDNLRFRARVISTRSYSDPDGPKEPDGLPRLPRLGHSVGDPFVAERRQRQRDGDHQRQLPPPRRRRFSVHNTLKRNET